MSSFIGAGFDAAEFAGVALFSRDADTVTAPALASMHDGGHYPDAGAFLHGWSTSRTLSAVMTTTWGVVCTLSIHSDDKVKLAMSGGLSFTVTPSANDPWGWGGVVASASFVAYATMPWRRGPVVIGPGSDFSVTRDGSTVGINPSYSTVGQSIPTLFTGPTASDPDEVIAHLEEWDNDACDATLRRIRWYIDEEGRTVTSWPESLTDVVSPTWLSTSLRRSLGFVGNEVEVLDATNNVYTLTSTYPALGVLICRRNVATLNPRVEVVSSARDLTGGRVAGRRTTQRHTFDVEAALIGGVGLDEVTAPHRDEAEIYRNRVAPYLFRGARCTFIPGWGDPRLGISQVEQFSGGLTAAKYSTTRNAEAGGIQGRRRCEVATDSPQETRLTFGSPRIETSIRLALRALPVA